MLVSKITDTGELWWNGPGLPGQKWAARIILQGREDGFGGLFLLGIQSNNHIPSIVPFDCRMLNMASLFDATTRW